MGQVRSGLYTKAYYYGLALVTHFRLFGLIIHRETLRAHFHRW